MSSSTTHWARRARGSDAAPPALIRSEALGVDDSLVVIPSADDLASGRRWTARFASAALRRMRRAIRHWRRRPPAAEAALAWLGQFAPLGEQPTGFPASSGQFDPCPGLTAGVLATMAAYGQQAGVPRLARWLESVQLEDGSFPDAGLRRPSPCITAQAACSLMAATESIRDPDLSATLDRSTERACWFLARWLAPRGGGVGRGGSSENTVTLATIGCLRPLAEGAVRFGQPEWGAVVDRARDRILRTLQPIVWHSPLHVLLPGVEALVELGETSLVERLFDELSSAQRRDGSLPALPGAGWVSTTGLAHLAGLWYRTQQTSRADRAMAWLRHRQETSGGFLGSYGRGACYYPRREVAWAAKHFLDASQRQVTASFQGAAASRIPNTIDSSDGRVQGVIAWCESMGAGWKVADVGCGRGRYLQAVRGRLPHLRFVGIDPSSACLAELPAGIDAIEGGMLNLPVDDGAFDAAMAIESLEHVLVPRRGVAELCRAVRSGGRVLIIDKERSHQPLSECEPWERWFTREEVSDWLATHCDEVKCFEVPHAEHREPTGLFHCWTATRR